MTVRTLSLLGLFGFALVAFAQAPRTFTYQGYLEQNGAPVNGTVNLEAALYYSATGSGLATQRTYNNLAVQDGVYSFDFDAGGVPFSFPLFMEIRVNGTTLNPRTPLTAAPYALSMIGMVPRSTFSNGEYLVSLAGGSHANSIGTTNGSTVSGGGNNEDPNTISSDYSTIGGGHANTVSGPSGTIAGGYKNTASGFYSTVGGGLNNVAEYYYTTVGGGRNNIADDYYSVVSGGSDNRADEFGATVPGGRSNVAAGQNSFAAGGYARSRHGGSFVWNGNARSIEADSLSSTAANQFLIRATGGVGIGTNKPFARFHLRRNQSMLFDNMIDGDDAIIEDTEAVLGLYSSSSTFWGSALVFGEVNGLVFQNKWALLRDNGNDELRLTFGTDSDHTQNEDLVRFETDGDVRADGTFTGGGADYAELLPLLNPSERIEPGDLVGVFGGHISRRTAGADRVMVVSENPAVLGNAPMDEARDDHLPVAFIGQVRVQVEGPVKAGDYILAATTESGRARAVSAGELRLEDVNLIAGQAWSGVGTDGRVQVEVGLDRTHLIAAIARRLEAENTRQDERLSRLEAELGRLQTLLAERAAR
ncbi:MAG: hypothetical protein AAGI08_03565 [Bacteroidota bacterium]